MNAIAIDDEPIALEIIRSHAGKIAFLDLRETFTDAFKALDYLQTENIDLIFLDIKMPDISGIEVYNSLSKKPLVIFTTAYSEHAVTSFELDAVDYLLKPFSLPRFLKACNKAYELFTYRQGIDIDDRMYIKTGYEQLKVLYDDILYLEANGNYVTFVLKDKNILSRITFLEAIQLLPAKKFVRIHRSFMVAIDKLDKIERHQVTINKKPLPIGELYSTNLATILNRTR